MTGLSLLLVAAALATVTGAAATGQAKKAEQRQYPRFWPGARWQIVYGSYSGVEAFAVDELQRMVQLPFPYVVEIGPAKGIEPAQRENLILVGTLKDNALIREFVAKGLLVAPKGAEGYSIACFDSPWKKGQRVIALAGADPAGVLYGVEDFNSRIVKKPLTQAEFDGLGDFGFAEAPAVSNRGIWTWGFVIYDYKRFFDHMARLKMNTLIVWNDVAPINAREFVDYAHSRGVRVVFGFHWGWGVDKLDPNDSAQRRAIKKEVVANFRDNYRSLGMDGIYFQTFTENNNLVVGGKSTAQLAVEWVNDIAADILKLDPKLRIEFGLHATSIRERYVDLAELDPRVTITWEDAGVLPYSYDPMLPDPRDASSPDPYRSLQATVDYSKKIALFRSNREFSMVAKGWTTLPWDAFEHHGEFVIGERDAAFILQRLASKQARWDFVNELWMKNYPHAARFYREVLAARPKRMSVTALVEDGLFEEKIQPSVALFAQTLWSPSATDSQLLERASSPYYGR